MKSFLFIWLLAHSWLISINLYLSRHGANWWQHFTFDGFFRNVRLAWQHYGQFLWHFPQQAQAAQMEFFLHWGVTCLCAAAACLLGKLFFSFGRGGAYLLSSALLALIFVSFAAYGLLQLLTLQ